MTARPQTHAAADVIALSEIRPTMIDLVGGKALGLGRMINSDERVPDGFCLTTAAHRSGTVPRESVLAAYQGLGGGRVAVRSSATAEDLPDASFAGQQETYLNVEGDDELITAIERCWASLDNERATAYRRARDWDGRDVSMAVVVQRMVEPRAAGVLFTANPITGTRTEMIIDAVPGLGDVVVDGSAETDHYVLFGDQSIEPHGCLSADDLGQLQRAGRRLERQSGQPQDIEWAIDDNGLWLLQSRAITTLFPVPADADEDDLRVYLEVGHMQGLRRPITPMGMSVLMKTTDDWFEGLGMPKSGQQLVADIAGRMFLDLTSFLRNARMRDRTVDAMDVYGPSVKRNLKRLLDDPRLAPRPGKAFDGPAMIKAMAGMLPRQAAGMIGTLAFPAAARRRAFRTRDQVRNRARVPDGLDATQRITAALDELSPVIGEAMMSLLPPLWVGLGSRGVAAGLLSGVAEPGEIDSIGRGMPYNVTTEMDLQLWSVAEAAAKHRDLFRDTPPEDLAQRYLRGDLPRIGLEEFLGAYGQRGAAEIDVGVPRWEEDPTPVFAALAGYLRVTDPEAAPDVRFERAAEEAEEALDRLVGRASRTRPVRAVLGGFLLRRWRALAGLRELPKFVWILPLREIRRQLLLAGEDMAGLGRIERAGDIMFLALAEAEEAASGTDHRELAAGRRAEYERESQRLQVPGLLLSDGTMPETLPDPEALEGGDDDHRLVGMPAAAGRATGTVRVMHDPKTARIEPDDILVAPTTDPGWTPLFLTAGGLVTETGSPIAHGPTVAREYGIPAVICVRNATTRLRSGQTVTIDGASGVVIIEDDQES